MSRLTRLVIFALIRYFRDKSMQQSQLFPSTWRANPKDETAINAQLLMRAGFIDKLMAGSYTFLTLGWRVKQKIEQIVREEMNAIGSQEVLMPLLHHKEIWAETGRWDDPRVKEIMYQFENNQRKAFGLSFTHEEIVLDLVRKRSLSHKQLPLKLYHFSTKFRNETRAKSGLLRGREFLMKDLYSLHASQEDLDKFYWQVKDAYLKVFSRVGLKGVRVVEAAGGVFTAGNTHEFQLLHPAGEDIVYACAKCDWAQNKEIWSNREYTNSSQYTNIRINKQKTCPRCSGKIEKSNAIEIGNIFRFGTSYCEKMKVNFKDKDGVIKPMFLGSYGIGISRLVGALAEIFNDEKGLIWPQQVAPFLAHLISLGETENQAKKIYGQLIKNQTEVLWDDRTESAGVKLADADLIGIPWRLVVSQKSLAKGSVEIKARDSKKIEWVRLDNIGSWIKRVV